MTHRRKTRRIKVGNLAIGGGAPVSVQSMTKTDTRDIAATVRQIRELEEAGCDLIRVAVVDRKAACSIRQIKAKIRIPLVADIHFHYDLAIEAIKSGADKIRLNPGNIRDTSDIAHVIRLAKKSKIPIRIGVNSGSVIHKGGGEREKIVTAAVMVEAALGYIKLFESMAFNDIIVSLKASDVMTTIEAYRKMAAACDYPFHVGVTAAGPSRIGLIKSSVGIGALLAEGIGDTIRVSLTGDPRDEVAAAKEILRSLGLRRFGIDIISCPTCGRCEVDLVKVVNSFSKKLSVMYPSGTTLVSRGSPRGDSHPLIRPLTVAIMGCVVNGPGEAREADIGIAAGKKTGMLFKKGAMIRKIKESDFVKVLLAEIKHLL